jgi:CRISPR-associated protein Cas2
MFWVVCYDIADDKRRHRVMKIMEGFGRRVQYSVFECELKAEQLKKLEAALAKVIASDEDSLRLYPLAQSELERVRLMGNAQLERLKESYII